jgi:hypothetical protein
VPGAGGVWLAGAGRGAGCGRGGVRAVGGRGLLLVGWRVCWGWVLAAGIAVGLRGWCLWLGGCGGRGDAGLGVACWGVWGCPSAGVVGGGVLLACAGWRRRPAETCWRGVTAEDGRKAVGYRRGWVLGDGGWFGGVWLGGGGCW